MKQILQRAEPARNITFSATYRGSHKIEVEANQKAVRPIYYGIVDGETLFACHKEVEAVERCREYINILARGGR